MILLYGHKIACEVYVFSLVACEGKVAHTIYGSYTNLDLGGSFLFFFFFFGSLQIEKVIHVKKSMCVIALFSFILLILYYFIFLKLGGF